MRKSSKGNPNHDERGRFCSSDKAKVKSFKDDYSEQTVRRRLNGLFSKEETQAYSSLKKSDAKTYSELLEKEPEITEMLSDRCNLIGLEYRVKSPSSIASKLARTNGKVKDLNDVLRYTHISEPKDLASDSCRILQQLKSEGVEIVDLKNTWVNDDNPYNGINVKLKKGDTKFELQFHTEESFRVKDGEMHRLYEKARELPPESEEYKNLVGEMMKLSRSMKRPKNIKAVQLGNI